MTALKAQVSRAQETIDGKVVAAFIGAAVGDALGWPYEDRARRVGGRRKDVPNGTFEGWVKRSGGRFQPLEEEIRPGQYSDDTQLILAVGRSLLRGKEWWRHLAYVELPFWSAYERGGGGATKRAVNVLLTGKLPWQAKLTDVEKYFDAGGNGVAMRVLPHVVKNLNKDFSFTAKSIVSDGVCTHGHPRALVGALAFAFVLRSAFDSTGTLSYGALVDSALQNVDNWAELPVITDVWPDWYSAAQRHYSGGYQDSWRRAVGEMVELLEVCRQGIQRGALAVDQQVLEKIGCFDSKMSGAGTVAAAAAAFLGSRHAATPINGMLQAAYAVGADTDTIASMSASLLGAIAELDWLIPFSTTVQDAVYLRELGRSLLSGEERAEPSVERVSKKHIDELFERFQRNGVDEKTLPDGRLVKEVSSWAVRSSSRTLMPEAFRVELLDGQTVFFKRLVKRVERELPLYRNDAETKPTGIGRFGITLLVSDLSMSRMFYEVGIGLPVTKVTGKIVTFHNYLALKASDSFEENGRPDGRVAIFLEVDNIDDFRRRLSRFGEGRLDPVGVIHGRRTFNCVDPDGYRIEVYERE
ncbi:ADP-ribosylglycohydrolase family protein [Azospirillum sp. Marseille-Q6669]